MMSNYYLRIMLFFCFKSLLFSEVTSYQKVFDKIDHHIQVEKVKEITLEETKEMIGYIGSVDIRNDHILITDPLSSKCLLFDMRGVLLRRFGRSGQGPGEFLMIHAACQTDSRVFVVDNFRIAVFNKDTGEFLDFIPRPFRSLCSSIHSGSTGDLFLISTNRYNTTKNTIFRINEVGKMLLSFSPLDKNVPAVMDTFHPPSAILMDGEYIYQVFNHCHDVFQFDRKGSLVQRIVLKSPIFIAPKMTEAGEVQGLKKEKEYRATFTQTLGIFKNGGGFLTVLRAWKDMKTQALLVEQWNHDFQFQGSVELPEPDAEKTAVCGVNGHLVVVKLDENASKVQFYSVSKKEGK